MEVPNVTSYLRNNLAKTKTIPRNIQKKRYFDIMDFYNSKGERFGYLQKYSDGERKYTEMTIFKDGIIYLYKSIRQSFQKIYSVDKTTGEQKRIIKHIDTHIIENGFEQGIKKEIYKTVDLITPHKLMDNSRTYEIDGKLKYSKPKVLSENIGTLKNKTISKSLLS